MKKVEGLTLRHIASENVIVSQSQENINYSRIISLNETAAWLWESLPDTDFSRETLVELLLENYEVDEQTAKNDIEELIESWFKAGIIIK